MNTKAIAAVLALILITSGCATGPAPKAQPSTARTFDQPFDKMWGKLVAEISAEYPLKVIEKASGVMETDLVQGLPLQDYAIQPTVFLGIWSATRAKLSIYVNSESDSKTSIRITGHFEALESNVTHQWYLWPSKGTLESSILDKLGS